MKRFWGVSAESDGRLRSTCSLSGQERPGLQSRPPHPLCHSGVGSGVHSLRSGSGLFSIYRRPSPNCSMFMTPPPFGLLLSQDVPYLDVAPYMPEYYKPQNLLDFEERLPSSDSLSLHSFTSLTSTNLEWDDSAIAPSSEGRTFSDRLPFSRRSPWRDRPPEPLDTFRSRSSVEMIAECCSWGNCSPGAMLSSSLPTERRATSPS